MMEKTSVDDIRSSFRTRSLEITRYLATLQFIDEQSAELTSSDSSVRKSIDITTRHVLKASVFVHLYNLVESTVSSCLHRVSQEILSRNVHFGELGEPWQKAWLQHIGKTSQPLSPDSRLANLLEICTHVVNRVVVNFKPEVSGGNLDDIRIEKLLERYGLFVRLPPVVASRVKKPVVDNKGPLVVVRVRRNELAHGLTSFADCGRDVSVRDLRRWTVAVIIYLRAILAHFERYLDNKEFMNSKP